jgi:hypothetical protein
MAIDDLLNQGIAAVKEGRKDKARRLLAQALEQDEHNEMAWLWMSGVVETDAERRICLENVLKINSSNTIAQRGLERLKATPGVSPFTTALPLVSSAEGRATADQQAIQPLPGVTDSNVPDEGEGQEPDQEEVMDAEPPYSPERSARRRSDWVIGIGAGVVVFVCIAAAGVWWAASRGLLAKSPTAVPVEATQATPTAQAEVAPLPSATRPPTWTPRPTAAPATLAPTRTPWPTETPRLTWTPTVTPTATLTGTIAETPLPALTLLPTWTPHPTGTPAPGYTPSPIWTPNPTSTPAPSITPAPTWTLNPVDTPAPVLTLPPTWTPNPTSTPAPGITLPPTWTPAVIGTSPITATATATPGG